MNCPECSKRDAIIANLVSQNLRLSQAVLHPPRRLDEIKQAAIEASVVRHEGDKQAAADELGISLKTLYNQLNRIGG